MDKWIQTPLGFFKLNFDWASKGNPGSTGYGDVFRNRLGLIIRIFFGTLFFDNNNIAELASLIHGLQTTNKSSLYPLIIEGDSKLIISLAKKIQCGSQENKVSLCR
jgi:ribonuclease HI